MVDFLKSNLLEPGAMFMVTEKGKDNTFSAGSTGFISAIRSLDEPYQNVAKISVIMTRRGKGGKMRLMPAVISTPVFYVDHKNFDKLLPQDGAKKYFLHIERAGSRERSVFAMDGIDFLGFAVAMARRMKHLSDQCRHKKWPSSKSNPLNILKRMPENFEGNPDAYLEKYTGDAFRANFVKEFRKMSTLLVRMHLQLDRTRAEIETNAAEFLLFTNTGEFIPSDAEDKKNEYVFTDDNKILEKTIAVHKHLKEGIEKLYNNKKKKS